MGSGHQLITIAGIFLLSTLILNVNKANSERALSLYASESVILVKMQKPDLLRTMFR